MASSVHSAVAVPVRTGSAASSRTEDEVAHFYGEFRQPVRRYLLSLRISPEDSEEIVQEVFLALFRHLREGKPRTNLRGWIFRVAHHLALKNRIRCARCSPVQDGAAQTDPALNPEELALGDQRQTRLLSVVRALPELDRACFSLRAEGLRYREIAETLGISLGSVSNALERALARLFRADGGF